MCKAILSINGTTYIALNIGTGPLKTSKKKWSIPLEIVLDGFGKEKSPDRKKVRVEVDIPKWLCTKGSEKGITKYEQEIGDWKLISLYFLLRIGEYEMMSDRNQTRQYKPVDIIFFKKDKGGNLLQLGQKQTDKEIMNAEGETLILMNINIGHKNACIHHENF